MPHTPFFSVAIAVYNKEKYIVETMESVLAQDFDDFEVVVVDDGSTDRSMELIKNMKNDRIRIFTQENQGASAARNHAIAKCSGKYIALIDADDLWTQHHLSDIKELIQTFPEAQLFATHYEVMYTPHYKVEANYSVEISKRTVMIDDYFAGSMQRSLITSSSVAFTREAFEKAGKFAPDIKSGEDTDLWIRLTLEYPLAFHLRNSTTYRSFAENNLTSQLLVEESSKLLNKYKEQEQSNPSLQKFMNMNRFAVAIYAKLGSNDKIFRLILPEISKEDLNFTQRLLLKMPSKMLILMKKWQLWLNSKRIYLTAWD
ncbi:hypothetical protein BST97_06265 [Nonlabens spongiae]|uniref:Glycosyltransferase 2-like domain-containing protein n=1 Tax=Nonlabens spongiae TaxID=331648 RepID=A0A1W6MJ33_9FLAO|nr:glycosyltransferase family A protein [Nonlabens spongiae]ARN77628.1 hypothetical protein BST97_06265 [Nonlabens spongiae]